MMPIVPLNEIDPGTFIQPKTPIELQQEEAEKRSSHWEVAKAAFAQDNLLVSGYKKWEADIPASMDTKHWKLSRTMVTRGERARRMNPLDPDFDPIALIPPDLTSFAEKYAYANSPEEVDLMSTDLRRQLGDYQTVVENGMRGFGWTMAAAMTSPETWLPFGAVGKSVSLANKMAAFAKAGLISSAASEALLHSTQNARTLETSMYAIAAGTILSAGLGGAVHGVQKAVGTREYNAARDIIAADLRRAVEEGEIPTTRVDENGVPILRVDENGVPIPDRSMGAAHADPELTARVEEEMLQTEGVYSTKKLKVTEAAGRALEAIPGVGQVAKYMMNPVKRLLESPITEVRQLIQKLQDPALLLNKNVEGQASVVSAAAAQRLRQSTVAKAASFTDEQYVKYVMGRSVQLAGIARSNLAARAANKGGDWKLSYIEFREAVGKAMRNNDTADVLVEQGLIPANAKEAVEASAQTYRKEVFDPILKELQEGGFLKDDLAVKTAESYLNRIYDRVALTQNIAKRQRFLNETVNWLKEKQGAAIERIQQFDAEHAALKNDVQFTKAKIEALAASANESASRAVYEKIAKDMDEWLEDSSVMDALIRVSEEEGLAARGSRAKSPEEIHAAATKSARDAYMKALSNALTEDVTELAKLAGKDAIDDAVGSVVGHLEGMGDDAKLDFVLKETPQPITKAVVEKVDEEFASGLSRAELEAQHAAARAYDKSLKAQMKAQAKAGFDEAKSPEENAKALLKVFRQKAKQEANKAGKKAATAVTKDLKVLLAEQVKAVKERVHTHRRDVYDSELDADDLYTTADVILRRITKTGGEFGYNVQVPTKHDFKTDTGGKSSPLQERKFLIDDDRIDFVLVNDVEKAAGAYVMGAGRDLELMKRFNGQTDPKVIMEQMGLEDTFREMHKKVTTDKELDKLVKLEKQTKNDIEQLIESFKGRYGVPDDPSTFNASLIRNVKRYNFVTKLPRMVLAATADVGKLPLVHGYDKIFSHALKPLIKHTKGTRLLKAEIAQLKLITEIHDNTRSRILEGLGDDNWHYNRVDRGLGWMADTFGIPTGMSPWNQFFKTADAVVTMSRIIESTKIEAAGGRLKESDSLFLRSNFISKEYAKIIAEQVVKHGKDVDGVRLPRVDRWDNIRVGPYNNSIAEVFKMAIQRQADNTIVSGSLETPTFLRTPLGSIIGQFRTFAFLTIPKTLQRMAQDTSETRVILGASTMIFFGMVSYALKQLTAGKDLSDDPKVWIAEGIDRAGILGIGGDALLLADKLKVGPRTFLGIEQASRFSSTNTVGALIGPTFGTMAGALGIIGGFTGELGEHLGRDGEKGWGERDTKTFLNAWPYFGLPYFNAIYNNFIVD